MWYLTPPSEQRLVAALAQASGRALSYDAVGASDRVPPAGFVCDHNRVLLGHGPAAFEVACEVLRRWSQFPVEWTRIWPAGTPVEPGRNLLMLARSFGVWWLNACRIVYVIDEAAPVRRFGFAYGTLSRHVECGEERFSVEWLADDSVWYDIRAFSRPNFWMVRLGYPLARWLQRRFARDSMEQVRQLVLKVTDRVARAEPSR